MNTETYILPAYWASYLINGDFSGLLHGEKEEIDSFIAGKGNCVSCSDEQYYKNSNDANNLSGDVLEYYFLP